MCYEMGRWYEICIGTSTNNNKLKSSKWSQCRSFFSSLFLNKNGELSHIGVSYIGLDCTHIVNFKKEAIFVQINQINVHVWAFVTCSHSLSLLFSLSVSCISIYLMLVSSSVNLDCALACCNMSILCQKHDPNIFC